jgi:mono/diheme cytochrome c family protein
MRLSTLSGLILAVASLAAAEDGAQVYNTLCIACHGPDGKGANGLPPLVGSEWPKGQPDRAIKIVLNGLTGPVEVAGKAYNIEMPPQGAVLNDEKIAAALTYVRTTFAGRAGAVTADQVKAIRASVADRAKPWTADELLKAHPFPLPKTALKNLVGTVYKGEWTVMPDFSTLKPAQIEDENTGIVSPNQSGLKKNYAMVWEGQFQAPADGKYTFTFDCDDFGALYLGGKKIAEIKGIGPIGGRAKQATVELKQGDNPFRLEYVQAAGEQVIILGWKGPKDRDVKWLSDTKSGKAAGPKWPSIPIQPHDGYTAVYRNFIQGTTPRGIGFGFPNGMNFAFSADNVAVELIWTGRFMDGGHHWTDRGQGFEPPAGEGVIKLSATSGVLASIDSADLIGKYRGYELDAHGNPTFKITAEGATLTDAWLPGERKLERTLSLQGTKPLVLLLERSLDVVVKEDGKLLEIGNRLQLSVSQSQAVKVQGQAVYLTIKPGETITLGYSFR